MKKIKKISDLSKTEMKDMMQAVKIISKVLTRDDRKKIFANYNSQSKKKLSKRTFEACLQGRRFNLKISKMIHNYSGDRCNEILRSWQELHNEYHLHVLREL